MKDGTGAAHQPLNIPKRKGSDTFLNLNSEIESSNHHSFLSASSPIGLDLDSSNNFSFPDSDSEQQPLAQELARSSPSRQQSFAESDDDFLETDDDEEDFDDDEESDVGVVDEKRSDVGVAASIDVFVDEDAYDGDVGNVDDESDEESEDESVEEGVPGGDDDGIESRSLGESSLDDNESHRQKLPQNDSSGSFDALLKRFDMGTCIVDLKHDRDCLHSPLKDGSNATGDDPPTYPTHPTTRMEDEHEEDDSSYEDEQVPLRISPSARERRPRPGLVSSRPPSISNSINSVYSASHPKFHKLPSGIPTVCSAALSTSHRGTEDASTAHESEATTFLLTEERVRAFMVDYYEDMDTIGQSKECLETFFRHYCIPELRWVKPSGNPVNLEEIVGMFTGDLKMERIWLVSVDSIQILAGGMAAVVTVTADQTFTYRGTHNGDRAVITSVLEVVNNGREIKVVHEHRTSGRPIPKESRWSTTES